MTHGPTDCQFVSALFLHFTVYLSLVLYLLKCVKRVVLFCVIRPPAAGVADFPSEEEFG